MSRKELRARWPAQGRVANALALGPRSLHLQAFHSTTLSIQELNKRLKTQPGGGWRLKAGRQAGCPGQGPGGAETRRKWRDRTTAGVHKASPGSELRAEHRYYLYLVGTRSFEIQTRKSRGSLARGVAGMKAGGQGTEWGRQKRPEWGGGESRLLSPGWSGRLAGLSTRQEAELPVRSGASLPVQLCLKMCDCCTLYRNNLQPSRSRYIFLEMCLLPTSLLPCWNLVWSLSVVNSFFF